MKLNEYLKDKTFDSAEIHNLSSGSFSLPGGRIIKPGEIKTLEELGVSKEIFDKFCKENHLENLTDSPKAKLKIKGIKQTLVKVEKESVASNSEAPKEPVVMNVKNESDEIISSISVDVAEPNSDVATVVITREVESPPVVTEVKIEKKSSKKSTDDKTKTKEKETTVEESI